MSDYNEFQQSQVVNWCQSNLDKVTGPGSSQWINCSCPRHKDDRPSLRINITTGGYHCNSGSCSERSGHIYQLAKFLGLPTDEIPGEIEPTKPPETSNYIYRDENWNTLVKVSRGANKQFYQHRWDGEKFVAGLANVRRVVYRLPEILQSNPETLYWVEGEKDVESLVSLGLQATTSPGGSKSLKSTCPKSIKLVSEGRSVVIMPDRDQPGKDYAKSVAWEIRDYATEVKIVELPLTDWIDQKKPNKDVTDWINYSRGGPNMKRTREELESLVAEYCEDRGMEPEDRPKIIANERYLDELSQEAMDAMKLSNSGKPWLFSRAGALVTITETNGRPNMKENNTDGILGVLAMVANWVHETKKSSSPTIPPQHVARNIREHFVGQLPYLEEIAYSPVMGSDGQIITSDGYHASESLYLKSVGLEKMKRIPSEPTRDDVEDCKRLIFEEWLCDYPFDSEGSRSHAVAMMLLPFVRRLVTQTPLHLIDSNTNGTGKTKLAKVLSIPGAGRPLSVISETTEDEEMRKRITSVLSEIPMFVLVDNLKDGIDSGVLASAITADTWKDRRMGTQTMTEFPVKAIWVATSKNARLSTEIARRTVPIRLIATEERPWERTGFKQEDLEGWTMANRHRLVWACLVLIRFWACRGMKPGEKKLQSFIPWSKVMGGILEACGIHGFLSNLNEMQERSDDKHVEWTEFISLWWTTFRSAKRASAELAEIIEQKKMLGSTINRQRDISSQLSRALSHQVDCVFGPHRIRKSKNSSGNMVYWLEPANLPEIVDHTDPQEQIEESLDGLFA